MLKPFSTTEPLDIREGRTLVLLDLDGVINDLYALETRTTDFPEDGYRCEVVESHGYQIYIPDYMPDLIQRLVADNDVWWLTTWREWANEEVREHLGIDPLPVITDGQQTRSTDWKCDAALDFVTNACLDGREVVWIEDFYGYTPIKTPHSATKRHSLRPEPVWHEVIYHDTGKTRARLTWDGLMSVLRISDT